MIARINQYNLGWQSILDSNFLGIGPDKYGVLSSVVKVYYCKFGMCTSTMDSTILKYTVNYGILYVLGVTFCLAGPFRLFLKQNILPEEKTLISMILFGIIMGCITGKLGAFPLNMFFYLALGALSHDRKKIVDQC